MPLIWIPAPLRDLTQGKQSVTVIGSTVREAIENLESQFPGIKERLCEGDKIRPNISVLVDGHVTALKIRELLQETSEVHFVVRISGGSCLKTHFRYFGTDG
jgi:molybdopterin converting factor small subunit